MWSGTNRPVLFATAGGLLIDGEMPSIGQHLWRFQTGPVLCVLWLPLHDERQSSQCALLFEQILDWQRWHTMSAPPSTLATASALEHSSTDNDDDEDNGRNANGYIQMPALLLDGLQKYASQIAIFLAANSNFSDRDSFLLPVSAAGAKKFIQAERIKNNPLPPWSAEIGNQDAECYLDVFDKVITCDFFGHVQRHLHVRVAIAVNWPVEMRSTMQRTAMVVTQGVSSSSSSHSDTTATTAHPSNPTDSTRGLVNPQSVEPTNMDDYYNFDMNDENNVLLRYNLSPDFHHQSPVVQSREDDLACDYDLPMMNRPPVITPSDRTEIPISINHRSDSIDIRRSHNPSVFVDKSDPLPDSCANMPDGDPVADGWATTYSAAAATVHAMSLDDPQRHGGRGHHVEVRLHSTPHSWNSPSMLPVYFEGPEANELKRLKTRLEKLFSVDREHLTLQKAAATAAPTRDSCSSKTGGANERSLCQVFACDIPDFRSVFSQTNVVARQSKVHTRETPFNPFECFTSDQHGFADAAFEIPLNAPSDLTCSQVFLERGCGIRTAYNPIPDGHCFFACILHALGYSVNDSNIYRLRKILICHILRQLRDILPRSLVDDQGCKISHTRFQNTVYELLDGQPVDDFSLTTNKLPRYLDDNTTAKKKKTTTFQNSDVDGWWRVFHARMVDSWAGDLSCRAISDKWATFSFLQAASEVFDVDLLIFPMDSQFDQKHSLSDRVLHSSALYDFILRWTNDLRFGCLANLNPGGRGVGATRATIPLIYQSNVHYMVGEVSDYGALQKILHMGLYFQALQQMQFYEETQALFELSGKLLTEFNQELQSWIEKHVRLTK